MDDRQFYKLAQYQPPKINWLAHDNYIKERLAGLKCIRENFQGEFSSWRLDYNYAACEKDKPLIVVAYIPASRAVKRSVRDIDGMRLARLSKQEIRVARSFIEHQFALLGFVGRIVEKKLPFEIFYDVVPVVSFRKS